MKTLAVMFALGVLLLLVAMPEPRSKSVDLDPGDRIENSQPRESRSMPGPTFFGVFWGAPFSFFRGIGVALVIVFWYTMLF